MSNTALIKKYLDTLENFKTSAIALTSCWDEIKSDENISSETKDEIGCKGYPSYLPSFDEFVFDVCLWDKKTKRTVEKGEIK